MMYASSSLEYEIERFICCVLSCRRHRSSRAEASKQKYRFVTIRPPSACTAPNITIWGLWIALLLRFLTEDYERPYCSWLRFHPVAHLPVCRTFFATSPSAFKEFNCEQTKSRRVRQFTFQVLVRLPCKPWYSSEASDIFAPIPRRHHLLQRSDSQWLYSDASYRSSRPVSPTASVVSETLSRRNRMLSFSALSKERAPTKSTPELHGWGRRWIRWMHHNGMRTYVTPCIVLGAALVKWSVGLGGYSGLSTIYIPFNSQLM